MKCDVKSSQRPAVGNGEGLYAVSFRCWVISELRFSGF